MNNWALKEVSVGKFGQEVISQASELSTNISTDEICSLIQEDQSKHRLIYVVGNPGSGRTTYCLAIVKRLIESCYIKESEAVFIKIDKHDNVNCVINCAIQLARLKKNFNDVIIRLASQRFSLEEKRHAIILVFSSFKLVCFDDLFNATNLEMFDFLQSVIKELETTVLSVISRSQRIPESGTKVMVNGINVDKITNQKQWQDIMFQSYFVKEKILNPKASKMLIKASKILNIKENECMKGIRSKTSVADTLHILWEYLNISEKLIMIQLKDLRRSLPLKDTSFLTRLNELGLVELSRSEIDGKYFEEVAMLSPSINEFVNTRNMEDTSMLKIDQKFDVFTCWMSLLSDELVSLLEDAKSNSWPFVPEKWQYVDKFNASKEKSLNVKDLITRKSDNFPHLTNFDILQEILHHSVQRKEYENVAAILFLIDRYIYWQGGSQILLDMVDFIMKEKPEIPIAPQLRIRKARVLRTSGDLQGAGRILDTLLDEKQNVGMWKYKEKHDHDLIRGVCVQIKGEIQSTLGQWYNSAVLLLDSVYVFKNLPKVDKKGLSCSLGLLVNTFQQIPIDDFNLISQKYDLKEKHPYIQAYKFAIEAADLAKYTPLFFARHKRRAGEMLFEYWKSKTEENNSHYLESALVELKESLAAHKNLDSLKSREQYYEFINALYKTSCVLQYSQMIQRIMSYYLKSCSMTLFLHYCLNPTTITHNEYSKKKINAALKILELPSYVEIDRFTYGTTEPLYLRRKELRLHDSCEKAPMVNRISETAETVNTQSSAEMVDRISETTETLTIDTQSPAVTPSFYRSDSDDEGDNDVHECEIRSYDAIRARWRTHRTLVYIGEPLSLSKEKEGALRDPYMVEYLSQDEPMGKYLGKQYKKSRAVEQYLEDVTCQMTARYYVGMFNEELYKKGIEVSPIQFLPVVMLQLFKRDGQPTSMIYNVEPYMQGNFTRLTNNWDFVNTNGVGCKLVLAFSHFTYEKSGGELLITDHQGWTTDDHRSTTFLTDPQIHSRNKMLYGTGNKGMEGMKTFWNVMHVECNDICKKLCLTRPS